MTELDIGLLEYMIFVCGGLGWLLYKTRESASYIKRENKVMKVELDKRDIIHLLRGVEPSYDTMGLIEDMELGKYTGGFKDSFDWNYATSACWDKYSDEKLFELYLKLVNKL